jgi:hypothetical protein
VTEFVFKSDGTPTHLQQVVLKDVNGATYRTFTNNKGLFEFPNVPVGPGQISAGSVQQQITVNAGSNYFPIKM